MKKMKKLYLTVLLMAFVGLSSLMAQPDPGEGGDPGGGPPTGGPSAPIGGGAGILVAFGLAYAISRYNFAKKEE
ncbi:MAG: hypothetical protein IPH45_11220 [Bacteroidales bacterium]|nr:hypothetical protein [Bacteroidales bacterium]MBK7173465.1 hypothetical protein [Bacteroidales bacterium]